MNKLTYDPKEIIPPEGRLCIDCLFLDAISALPRLPSPESHSPAARGGNLAKIPPNQVIDDFGRGSSVESKSE